MNTWCVLVTLNCGKTRQDSALIASVLEKPLASLRNPDYIVFCLQEIAPIPDASLGWTDDWIQPFKDAVPSGYLYLGKSVCGGCAVVAFTPNYDTFNSVYYDTCSFGMLWSSLKGAALLSITLPKTRGKLTFISSHLCANEGHKEDRNRDFNYMIEKLSLSSLSGQVIIAGDLNYRTTDASFETDELQQQIKKGIVGKGFVEAPVKFKPTYKYHVGTNDFNSPHRIPSYCDRILFRDLPDVSVLDYNSVMLEELRTDHKPVYAVIGTPTSTVKTAEGWATSSPDVPTRKTITQNYLEGEFLSHRQLHALSGLIVGREHNDRDVSPPTVRSLRKQKGLFSKDFLTVLSDVLIGITAYSWTMTEGRKALVVFALLLLCSRF